MSPPTSSSSSSSQPQRRPLHERSKSENNKLGIRIVPYSPPRISHGETEPPSSSQGTSSGAGVESSSNFEYHSSSDQASSSPTIREGRKGSLPFIIGTGSAQPSPTSSTASLVRAKGKGVSGSKLGSDLSGAPTPLHPVNSKSSYGSNNSRLNPPSDTSEHGDPATPTQKFVRSKADRFINVHEDKTFSVVLKPTGIRQPRDQGSSSQATSFKSPPLSYASTLSSAHERISFDTTTVDHPSSPPSSVADVNLSPYTPYAPGFATYTPGSTKANDRIEEEVDPITSSPNYRMVGGLRKVRKTTSFRQSDDDEDDEEDLQPQLPPLPEVSSSPPPLPSPLAEKPSFSSTSSGQTDSSLEEPNNFEILGRSSPPLPYSTPPLPYSENFEGTPSSSQANYQVIGESPSSSQANFQVIGESSPSQPFVSSPGPAFAETPASQNYVVHGGPSSSTSLATPSRQPRPQTSDDSLVLREKYSQESLVIPPLNPSKQTSRERLGYHKQKSSRSLRRANSFSSLSSIITEGSASIFFAQTANIIRLGAAPAITSFNPPQRTKQQHHSWAGPSSLIAQRPRMEAHPHQWSSQLSTVASEDEPSERASRALSSLSGPDPRMSMSHGSRHSRQMLSISSSLAFAEEPPPGSSRSIRGSTSGSDSRGSLVSPGIASLSSAYIRGGRDNDSQPIRVVRDVDEDGDGITDLHDLMHKNSSRLLSHKSSDRELYSSSSSGRPASRTGSFTSSIPVWARVYYGSGERRWLASAQSIRSYSDDSRPGSAQIPSGSPSVDPFPPNVFSPRRRPREVRPHNSRPASIEIDPIEDPSGPSGFVPIPRRLRKMSSSIWSPHLQIDRRASRFSIWAPPSTTWSKDKGTLGRRNLQIVMFALGWVFPFAWMIAAVLPLPHKPLPQMTMADHHSTAELGGPIETPDIFSGRVDPAEDSNYQSARWWRNVNRFMCIVGLLIIGAVIALIIVGLRQNWGG